MRREAKLGIVALVAVMIGAAFLLGRSVSRKVSAGALSAPESPSREKPVSRAEENAYRLDAYEQDILGELDAEAPAGAFGPGVIGTEASDPALAGPRETLPAPPQERQSGVPTPGSFPQSAPAPAPQRSYLYVVQPGDSAWKIALKVYGAGVHGTKILDANADLVRGSTVSRELALRPGLKLLLPEIPGVKMRVSLPGADGQAEPRPAANDDQGQPRPPGGARVHVVQKGDTLFVLAQKYYGAGTMWTKIAAANRDLQNPNRLQLGQQILLPEP